MCAYGLRLPGAPRYHYCRKATVVSGNFVAVESLSQSCPGLSPSHHHDHCWGHRRIEGRSVSLAAAAGRYPIDFASSLAGIVKARVQGQ